MVFGARNAGFTKLIVPALNADEAALVADIEFYAVDSLHLRSRCSRGHGSKWRRRTTAPAMDLADELVHGDLVDVRGHSPPSAPLRSPPPAVTIFCSSDLRVR